MPRKNRVRRPAPKRPPVPQMQQPSPYQPINTTTSSLQQFPQAMQNNPQSMSPPRKPVSQRPIPQVSPAPPVPQMQYPAPQVLPAPPSPQMQYPTVTPQIAPVGQPLPPPPPTQQLPLRPPTTNPYSQYPIPSVNGAFRENNMQNPQGIRPTIRSPQQRDTEQKMGILNNPAPIQTPAAVNQVSSVPTPAVQTPPVQQQTTAEPVGVTASTVSIPEQQASITEPTISSPAVAPTSTVTPVPEVASSSTYPSKELSFTPEVAQPVPSPITTTPTSVSSPASPVSAPAITQTTNTTPVSDEIRGGNNLPLQNPNVTPTVPQVTPTVPPQNPLVSNEIRGGGVSPRPTPAIPPVVPTMPPITPAIPPVTPTVPPVIPSLPPSNPLLGDTRGGGTTPRVTPNISTTVTPTTTTTTGVSQDNSQAAATWSAQNPYSSIYGGMQDPLAYLQGEGINVGQEYSKYFQAYDPAREQAAYQQYGLGQQAQMMGARAGLMGLTQQQGAGGFAGVGFGGSAARGMRGQFGLGQQQAALGLRGDVYGMRRAQEESWWDTLARVEESRGEPFGLSPTTTAAGYRNQTSSYTGDQTWMPPQNPSFDETYEFDGETYYWDPSSQEWITGT